jgi:hypothetical protein
MSAAPGIQCFLATASGPATLYRQLHGRTLAIRSLPRSLRAIHFVESRFADELFGEQLLSILSDKLRALLQSKDAILAAPQPSPALSPHLSREEKTSHPQTDASSRNTSAESPFVTGAPHPSGKHIPGQAAALQSLPSWEPAVSNTKDNLIAFAASSRGSGEADASFDVYGIPPRAKNTAAPLIVKLIRQYWSQEVQKQNHHASLETPPVHVQSSSTPEPGTKTNAERTRTLPADQIVDRMRAFVSGPFLRSPRPRSSDALDSIPPSNPATDRKEPAFATPPRWASSRNDLEEKLVDILREQAMQHGIDIS